MDVVGVESLISKDHLEVVGLTNALDMMVKIRDRVAVEGMCRDDAVALEQLVPGVFESINTAKFTYTPSKTQQSIALEAIDWKKGGLIAAAVIALLAIIAKVIGWLNDKLLGGLGNGGKNITNPDKVDAAIARRATDNVTREMPTLKATARAVEKKTFHEMSKMRIGNAHYIQPLLDEVEKIRSQHGDDYISSTDIQMALGEYATVLRRLNISDRDNTDHAILGNFLTTPGGGIPFNVTRLEWPGKDSKVTIGPAFTTTFQGLIEYGSVMLDRANAMSSLLKRIDFHEIELWEDNHNLYNATKGPGKELYELMELAAVSTVTFVNWSQSNPDASRVFAKGMVGPIKISSGHGVVIGKISPSLNADYEKLMVDIQEDRQKVLTYWVGAKCLNGRQGVSFLNHLDTAKALTNAKSRQIMSDQYSAVYVDTPKGTRLRDEGLVRTLKQKMSEVNENVKKIKIEGAKPTGAWMYGKFAEASDASEYDHKPSPMNTIMVSIDNATRALTLVSKMAAAQMLVYNSSQQMFDFVASSK